MSTVVSRAYYGEIPAFPIPPYTIVNYFVELPLYTLMAILVGVAAVVHIRFFYLVRDRFQAMRLHSQVKPILGAFLVGSIAIYFPQVMGDGYHYITKALAGDTLLWRMALLVCSNPWPRPLPLALAEQAACLRLPCLLARCWAAPTALSCTTCCLAIQPHPALMPQWELARFLPPPPTHP